MSLFEYYIQYLTQVCEGSLTLPDLALTGQTPEEKALELQTRIGAMGIPEFVRKCAAAEGKELPQELYDSFSQEDMAAALSQLLSREAPPTEAPEVTEEPEASEEPKQNVWEAFLDCLSLEDALLEYLIQVLKDDDGLGFFRLSQVTVRQELRLADFLYWFGTKELYAEETERGCVTVIDALLDRLAGEGQLEAVAALIAGDRTTYELIRSEAPELRQAPAATYEWFEEYYLNRYYPLRAILRLRGIRFPTLGTPL